MKAGEISLPFVRVRLDRIAADLAQLNTLAAMTRAEVLANPILGLALERLLYRLLGRVIDINYHLVTSTSEPPPMDYYRSFFAMGRIQVISDDLAFRLAKASGLFLRLSHDYGELDAARLFDGLTTGIAHLREFAEQVELFCFRK